jgi:hypothetical protein
VPEERDGEKINGSPVGQWMHNAMEDIQQRRLVIGKGAHRIEIDGSQLLGSA